MPPSAKKNACVEMTTAMTRQASHGPSSTAARAAPRKWPLVPPATGKLSICAAKMNAAVTPSSGMRRSSSRPFVLRTATASTATVGTQHAAATPVLRNPSGMCMSALPVVVAVARMRVVVAVTGVVVPAARPAHAAQSPTIGKWLKRAT